MGQFAAAFLNAVAAPWQRMPSRSAHQKCSIYFLCALAIACANVPGSSASPASGFSSPAGGQRGEPACTLQVTTPRAPPGAGILAEPYKPTAFVLSCTCDDGNSEDCNTEFEFFSTGSEGQTAQGLEFSLTFKEKGRGQLSVLACPKASSSATGCNTQIGTKSFVVPVAVTYVRREIRDLPIEERERYFSAIRTLLQYSTEKGRQIFGPGYTSYYELLAFHMAGVWVNVWQCDLGHHGPALLTFHRGFSRMFEKAIQAVDPSLASPYWDYLRDGGLLSPEQSTIWSSEYFGNITGDPNNNYQVLDGKFPAWPVPFGEEATSLSQMTWGKLGPAKTINPYGYFRSPDSTNPNPHLTRFGPAPNATAPAIESWLLCAASSGVGEFASCLDGSGIHPAPHILVGGTAQTPAFVDVKDQLDCSSFNSTEECEYIFNLALYFGGTYRYQGVIDGCIVCDRKCSNLTKPPEECGCRCADPRPPGCAAEQVLLRFADKYNSPIPPELITHIDFIYYGMCGASRANGDYADAGGSPIDPIFWIHHSNLDRILSSWRILHPTTLWEHLNFTSVPSGDPSFYPDVYSSVNIIHPEASWPGVVFPGDRNPLGICIGHGLFDEIASGAMIGVFDAIPSNQPHTNIEMLKTVDVQLNDPASADYIYDQYYEAVL